jgi:glucose/arabinose dehydrogenase
MLRKRPPAIALAALALAGCNGDDDDEPRPRSESPLPTTRTDRGERRVQPAAEPQVSTVASGLEIPWEIAFLPDGRALVTERPGRVRLLSRAGRLREQPVAQIDVDPTGEGGLLGMAVDPEFERNRFVYLYRTTGSGNEVLRYTLDGRRLVQDARILDGLQAAPIHDGGRIHFGPDGLLYVSTGEAGNGPLAQDRGSLNGKLLRLRDPRGSGRPEIVSLGHRNVQGFDWEPGSERLVATEFGPESDDEVNVIRRGGNYGWPEAQGDEGGPRFIRPIVNYEAVIAPSGATFVTAKGSAWSGSYLFGTLVGQHIRRLELDGSRAVADEKLFEGRFGRVRTVVQGPDGALYALTSNRDGRGSPREGDDHVLRIVPPR